MKRLIYILLIAAAALSAQRAEAQFRYAATAGVNISDLYFKQDLTNVSQSVGYSAGVQGELMFPGIGFGIDLGLLYNQLGATVDLGDKFIWSSQGYGNERVYLHYIQIPFHLRFKWTRMDGLEEKIAPFVTGGPDFTILAGHNRCKAFEYAGGELGLTAGIGAEIFRRWQVTLSYTWGMTYALKTKLLEDNWGRNRAWAVRLSYFF